MIQEPFIRRFCFLALLIFTSLSVRADILDNWTTNQIATNDFAFNHVVYGNGIYVAVADYADSGAFYTSTDGFQWVRQYSEPVSWGATLNYSGGHFASCGPGLYGDGIDGGVENVSADGTNWVTTLSVPVTPIAITYGKYFSPGKSLYVLAGSTNNVASIMSSPDGVTWTSRTVTNPGGPLNGIAFGNGIFVAIGNNDGSIYVSSSGTGTWSKFSLPGGNKISFANNIFFVPLNNQTNLLSLNGSSWSAQATGLTNGLGAVTYTDGVYMAQCAISPAGSYLATSADGTNWFQYPTRLPNACASIDALDYDVNVATDGSRLVTGSCAVTNFFAYNSYIYTSGPLVFVSQTNNPPRRILISGLVGRSYQVQSVDALGNGSNWRTNVSFQLTNTPFIWVDGTATNSARFYRGVLLP
ncbi:MAG TPA: hypothetical protein VMH87_19815 [Pseudomonadales bacterium]|nr:hypothetical protein [Pseudomonadales bacterium]